MSRELSPYERKAHNSGHLGKKHFYFQPPETLPDGTEWGEYMDALKRLIEMGSSYGMSGEFEKAAEAEYLDRYYEQIETVYLEGRWGYDTPEDFLLPPKDEVVSRDTRLIDRGVETDTAWKMALDWAMRRREKNVAKTNEVFALLRGVYTTEGARQWLNRKRMELDGKTPLQALLAGNDERVRELAEAVRIPGTAT